MQYFVTGGTGFIGRFVIEKLLARGGTVHVLVRAESTHKFERLKRQVGATDDQLKPVIGDLTKDGLTDDAAALKGNIDHVFHLAAIYDMNMDDAAGDAVNNDGTRRVVAFANDLGGNVQLHHVSSVAVAGGAYKGTFMEAMFDEGQDVAHPYYRTKYESEQIVRDGAKVPFKIYRPGMVVGSSETGEIDKIDGPYYLFKHIQRLRDNLPTWVPLVGLEGGKMPLAPVDYVAAAMDYIAHTETSTNVFQLVQSPAPSAGEMVDQFARVAHAPELSMRINHRPFTALLPMNMIGMVGKLPVVTQMGKEMSKNLGVPAEAVNYMFSQAKFDDRDTKAALEGSGISCPPLESYAWKLWDYWERVLDPAMRRSRGLKDRVSGGKTVVITGGSSGIGLASAHRLAEAGANVVLVARTVEKLVAAQEEIEAAVPGASVCYYSCDLNDMDSIEEVMEKIEAEQGGVEILINNAGRSIRRAVVESLDRFHDFERTIQLNYFGAIKAIITLLPHMKARKRGHVINISSIGCLTNVPRFSAYVASKSALDAFSRCFSAEVKADNIDLTTIYMPLVATPMIAPTTMYQYVPTLTPDEAADLVAKAVIERPKKIATRLGSTMNISYQLWPKVNDFILNIGYKMFPSSAAAKGGKDDKPKAPSPQSVAMAHFMKGVHW